MEITINCKLAGALAERMREAQRDLTQRWLDRIVARVTVVPEQVFPTDDLLDHVPLLVAGIAGYLEEPSEEISADGPVIAKAQELGELRFSQGFDAHQILKEYEILGGVLFAFLVRTVDEIEEECTRGELLACAHRLFRAISVIQQVTMTHYLREVSSQVRSREQQLRGFNRMLSHEMKNHIGAILGAGQLLDEGWLEQDAATREKFLGIIRNNAEKMQSVLTDLLELSRLDGESRRHRNVLLPEIAAEVGRQLREMAAASGVDIRLGDLPPVEVNAPALELCLSNYVSNAIKYRDPAAPQSWVEIRGCVETEGESLPSELIVSVRDNGLGVSVSARKKLFERFFRAHDDLVDITGTGLGLSIVRETIESLGGRAWAEFDEPGVSRFSLAIPLRRSDDADALDAERAASA
jgi:signal transduction histidine kinase